MNNFENLKVMGGRPINAYNKSIVTFDKNTKIITIVEKSKHFQMKIDTKSHKFMAQWIEYFVPNQIKGHVVISNDEIRCDSMENLEFWMKLK